MADMALDAVSFQTPDETMQNKFLIFSLDSSVFAMAISYVVDIINILPVVRIPNCPDYVKGIANLRGKVIPIVDLRLRLGREPKEYHERTCVVVVEQEGESVGLVVDEVQEVIHIKSTAISPPPTIGQTSESKYVKAIGETPQGIRVILDCEAILNDTENETME